MPSAPSRRSDGASPSFLRRSVQVVGVMLASAAVGIGSVWAFQTLRPRAAAPEVPFDEVALPGSEFLNVDASIRFYEQRVERGTDRVSDYVALAQLYLQKAAATADEPTFVPLAEKMLGEALRRDPEDFHARALHGTLLNKLHRFEDAEAVARGLMREHDGNVYPYGVLVDALVELGRYDEAVAVSDSMLALRPGVAAYSRASYLRELHGDAEGAIEAMRLAADAGVSGREDRAWALHQLAGLYLGQGDTARARVLYTGILEERASFEPARVGLAHLQILAGAPAEAVAMLHEVLARVPLEDAYALLEEAHRRLGNDAQAERAARSVAERLDAAEKMGENVQMETADFWADRRENLGEAERRARREVLRRPGHLHANETFAWVRHQQGHSREAVPYIERALRLGTGDAMVHFRAAEIYAAAGDAPAAARHYRAALDGRVDIESGEAAARARQALAARPGAI